MNALPFPRVEFSADGFTARPEIVSHAEARAVALRRHIPGGVSLVRIRISRESALVGPAGFIATAIAKSSGSEFVAHGVAGDPLRAIDESLQKIERAALASGPASPPDRTLAGKPGRTLGEPPSRR